MSACCGAVRLLWVDLVPTTCDRGGRARTPIEQTAERARQPPGSDRRPPLNSRFATRARRSGDFAQVERFHGFRRRIAAACRPHRCCVQSFASAARKGSRRIAIPGLWRRHMDDGPGLWRRHMDDGRDQCANALAATLGDRGDGVVAAKPDDCGWRERATVSARRTACFCCSRSGSTAHFINCHIQ
jgi:hypothetical protein